MFGFSSIDSFLDAVPTAELEPSTDGYVQNDEDDIGLTYSELNDIGKLRKVSMVSLTVSLTVSLMFFDISLTLSKERRMYTCLCLFIYKLLSVLLHCIYHLRWSDVGRTSCTNVSPSCGR